MANKKLSAVITIGGAVASTFGTAIKSTTGRIKEIGKTVRSLEKDHKALGSQIEIWEKQGKNVASLRTQYVKLGSEIDRLRLKQSALKRIVDADVAGSFTRMGSTIKSTALMFTGLATAAIGGIFAIAKSTSDLGDEIGETAQKLGIGTQELQELRYAALKAGGQEVEQFDKSMELMIKNVTEAANGTGKAVSALEELGLQAGALASMTPDEMLNHIADAMGKVENHSEKLRLALRIFGKGGAPMLLMLDQGSKGLAEFRRQARATGFVLSDQAIRAASDFDDQLRDLKLSALGVRNTLGAALMPVVTRVMGRMTTYLQSNRGEVVRFANQFAAAVERAAPTLFKLADGVLQFAKFSSIVIGKVAHMVGGFENLGFIIGAAFSAKSIFSVISFGGALLKAADGLQMFFTGKSAIVGLSKGFQFLGKGILSLVKNIFPLLLSGIRAIGVAATANPVGAIIAGVAIAAILIIANWKRVKPFFESLWASLKPIFAGAWAVIKTVAEYTPLGILIKNWKPIVGFFSALWLKVKSVARTGINLVFKVLDISPLEVLRAAWSGITAFFGSVWDKVKSGADSMSAKVKSIFGFSPVGLLKSSWAGITGFFDSTKDSIATKLSSLGEALKTSPLANFSPDWAKLKTKFEGIWNSIKNVLSQITDGIKKAFEFKPLAEIKKVWEETFKWLEDKATLIGTVFGKVSRFFGFGEKDDDADLAKPKATIPLKSPLKVKLPTASNSDNTAIPKLQAGSTSISKQFTNTFNITVNASSGQDEQSIARKVMDLIIAQQQKAQGSLMFDGAGAY